MTLFLELNDPPFRPQLNQLDSPRRDDQTSLNELVFNLISVTIVQWFARLLKSVQILASLEIRFALKKHVLQSCLWEKELAKFN